jgi:DNA-binding transcriptional LysR family regulator
MQEKRTMSDAAKDVHLTQPAASRLLRSLSDDLSIELFERSGRTLRPTTAGETMLRYSREIIAALDRAHLELEAIDEGMIGRVSVGAGIASCYVLIPETIALLMRSPQKIAVTVREGSMEDLLAKLREGSLDIVVGRIDNTGRDRDLVVEDLYDPMMHVIAGPNHKLGKSRELKWEDLLRYSWILPELGTPMRTAIENVFRKKRLRPASCIMESSSIQTNIGLLNRSDLLWVLSNDVAVYFQKLGLTRILPIPAMPGPSPFIVAHARNKALSPAATIFLELLRSTAKSGRH